MGNSCVSVGHGIESLATGRETAVLSDELRMVDIKMVVDAIVDVFADQLVSRRIAPVVHRRNERLRSERTDKRLHSRIEARFDKAEELAGGDRERALCSNACLLARALWMEGEEEPLFADGEQVLIALTAEEIEALCARWDEFRRSAVPNFSESVEYGYNSNFHPPEEVSRL
jgi:hypothetical protein